MKTTNRREEYTKRTIRESFCALLMQKPVEKISVGELCQLADVNRSTFYRHYADLYTLLDTIVADCQRELFHDVASNIDYSGRFEDNGYAYILQICTATEKNKAIYKALLFGHSETHFMQRIADSVFQLYLDAHMPSSYLPAPEVRMHYHFFVYGLIGTWVEWVREDCTLPKEVVAKVAQQQSLGFFNKMNELFWPKDYSPDHPHPSP